MTFAKNLLIFAIFCSLQHFVYLTEISDDKRIQRVKRQCGCCPCYGSGTSSCGCSSLCPCGPGTNYNTGYNNYGTGGYGINGINFDAAYGGYILNPGNPYSIYGQYGQTTYGSNYNIGTGCGIDGTATSAGCGTNNMLPYNYGTGYGTGNTGYIYPQITGCSTAFNTRCYCGTGYSPCNNGAFCCRNGSSGLMTS